ncbi:diguanylate cyclase (GGDEF domain) [hydrothermal vent metagenome]|uniref:Diguanylate cyclase (GGDEF domain) n=1 Tax=hydrothermal vent metagenome TaxID=652676 RepID=A0A1W1CN16_9ZZZZ
MQENRAVFKIITNETKENIENMKIVTPSIYSSIFSKFADEHHISLENEEEISRKILEEECTHLEQMQERTAHNANLLNKNTTKAINAIKEKNDTLLNEVLHETEALRLEVEKLRESVYQDELTHTHNRKWLHDNYMQDDNESFNQNGLLVLLDLNYFKQINDTHGHIIGDKVLIFIANRLKSISKNVVRYGGDEFLVLFSKEKSLEQSSKILNKLRESILTKKLKAHEEMFTLSFSFGITPFQAGEKLTEIIERADANMYDDKVRIKQKIKGI